MMDRNKYRDMMEGISVPEGLNERVLWAARKERPVSPAGREKRRAWGRPVLRTAVCAACALALVLGSVHLRTPAAPASPAPEGENAARQEEVLPALPLSISFGLTAYAADTGSAYPAREDGAIAFAMGEGMVNPGEGDFTGCLFQITGEDIASVALSIDRGGLYRHRTLENLTDEEMAHYREIMGTPELATAAISQLDDGTWYMPEKAALGSVVKEDYDPEAWYGFWLSPEEAAINTGLGITTEAQMDADFFDGGVLSVTVTSTGGAERTQVYRLHAGELKVEFAEDNTILVLPELAGEKDPFVYGIYAVPEE